MLFAAAVLRSPCARCVLVVCFVNAEICLLFMYIHILYFCIDISIVRRSSQYTTFHLALAKCSRRSRRALVRPQALVYRRTQHTTSLLLAVSDVCLYPSDTYLSYEKVDSCDSTSSCVLVVTATRARVDRFLSFHCI